MAAVNRGVRQVLQKGGQGCWEVTSSRFFIVSVVCIPPRSRGRVRWKLRFTTQPVRPGLSASIIIVVSVLAPVEIAAASKDQKLAATVIVMQAKRPMLVQLEAMSQYASKILIDNGAIG